MATRRKKKAASASARATTARAGARKKAASAGTRATTAKLGVRKKVAKRAGLQRATAKRATAKRASGAGAKGKAAKKWSAGVMAHSDAMDLENGVFKKKSAHEVALSLKRSVESSHRRKSPPFRSAMSMLNFEINRGGKNLSAERKHVLNQAKDELRKLFNREPAQ